MVNLYGVNRMTVRMALKKLNALGIIETRVGDESYIKDFSLARIFDSQNGLPLILTSFFLRVPLYANTSRRYCDIQHDLRQRF